MKTSLIHEKPVLVWTGDAMLDGHLVCPASPSALIVIASLGGTASRDEYRHIAQHLEQNGFAVLLADVLTSDEQQFDSRTAHFRTDIKLLAARLDGIAGWVSQEPGLRELPISLFASSTVAAAALTLSTDEHTPFAALVLAEVRTDMVTADLAHVRTPALLLAAEEDHTILRMSRDAVERMSCDHRLEVFPDSVRVIGDNMNTEAVARITSSWLAVHALVGA